MSDGTINTIAFCLHADMIGSTERIRSWPLVKRVNFETEFLAYLGPLLSTLELNANAAKNVGDGWFVWTEDPNKIENLCCLAVILSRCFQRDLAEAMELDDLEDVPALRIAICAGRDRRNKAEFSGDSARRAARSAECCYHNEVLVDDFVRSCIDGDFLVRQIDLPSRPPKLRPKHEEEKIHLFTLEGLRFEAMQDAWALPIYPHVLERMAQSDVAMLKDSDLSVEALRETLAAEVDAEEALEDTKAYNLRIKVSSNFGDAVRWFNEMKWAEFEPDIGTYSALISMAPNYDVANALASDMVGLGLRPNLIIFSSLIAKAQDYKTADGLLGEMRKSGVAPNAFCYNVLISKAPDFKKGRKLFEDMKKQGVKGNTWTFHALFAKEIENCTGAQALGMFWEADLKSATPLDPAVIYFAREEKFDDAFEIALYYPQLNAARKLIRQFPEKAEEFFVERSKTAPLHKDVDYALATVFLELGKTKEAAGHLRKALEMNPSESRRNFILTRLESIGANEEAEQAEARPDESASTDQIAPGAERAQPGDVAETDDQISGAGAADDQAADAGGEFDPEGR